MEETKEWLKKSLKDLRAAKKSLNFKEYEWASFQSQQSAEKALKALYIKKFGKLWKIHDLAEIGKKLHAPTKILELCDALNPDYIATRYPVYAKYDKRKAINSINAARKIIKWVKKLLKI